MKQVKNFESKEVIEYLRKQCEREGYNFNNSDLYIDDSNDWRNELKNLQKNYNRIFCCNNNNTFYAICFK